MLFRPPRPFAGLEDEPGGGTARPIHPDQPPPGRMIEPQAARRERAASKNQGFFCVGRRRPIPAPAPRMAPGRLTAFGCNGAGRAASFGMAACRDGSPRQGWRRPVARRPVSPADGLERSRSRGRVGVRGRAAPDDRAASVARRGSGAERPRGSGPAAPANSDSRQSGPAGEASGASPAPAQAASRSGSSAAPVSASASK